MIHGEVDLDILASIAEISVAFAGFASIITALSGRRFGELEEGNLTRFRLMIYSSLSATFAALMPYLMAYNSEVVDWWLCILLLTIFLMVFLAFLIRTFVTQVTQGLLSGRVAFSVALIGIVATTVQLLSLFGVFEPDLGIYLFGVYYLLIQSGISFTRLITASVRSHGTIS